MFKVIVFAAVACAAIAYEVRSGSAYFYCRRLRWFSWDYQYIWVTRDEQPVGYWLLIALHTAFAGVCAFACWADPGHS